MRLAYVCQDPGIPPDGTKGASVHFRALGRSLRDAFDGHVTTLMTRPSVNGGSSWPVTVVPAVSDSMNGASTGVARELALLTGQGPLLEALGSAGEIDAVYERYSLFGMASAAFARSRGIPHLVEVNAPLWQEASAYRALQGVDLAREIGRTVLGGATRVFAVSAVLAQRVVDLGIAADRVEVFPNGVDERIFHDPMPVELPEPLRGRPVALFAGSLKPWHGIDALLSELSGDRWSNLGVWIVGDGPLRGAVDSFVRAYPRRAVWWPGVDHDRMPSVYAAASFSVAPYPADAPDYFSPLKVTESLGAGCPVLTTTTCRLSEDLQQAPGVLRYHPMEKGDLERTLEALLEDLAGARRGASVTRDHVVRHHTWQARAATIRAHVDESVASMPTGCAT